MRTRTKIAIATFVLFAAACGGDPVASTDTAESPVAPGGGSSSATEAPEAASPVGIPEILEFEAPLLGGGTLRGVDYAGKDVAFWFWAPW